ncbi:UDP-glucose 4-epimerase [hydrothermal vent metagenome]|uniref:UDP-glucose 4-epimerase n=1 Tax=hydrothermal vent metagenome TaxID=652676 RepID=A0A3B1D9H8_9ZZZZ
MNIQKKIIVTGGAGFIGSHTAVELVNANYVPIIIDDLSNSEAFIIDRIKKITGHDITFYEGDCNNTDFLNTIFAKEKNISGVIHFAAFKAVGESTENPIKYYRNNIESLLTLLDIMLAHDVHNLVFSSSATVYGQPDILPATEETPTQPAESPYGNTKKICEEILRDVVKSNAPLKTVAPRYFNPIGAHSSGLIGELPRGIPNNLVPFITQTAAGIRENITVFGDDYSTPDGTCIRDYIHVVDLAKAHVKTLAYLEKQTAQSFFDIVNIGTGKGNSVLEALMTFEKVNDLKLNYTIGKRRQGDVESLYANVDKARDVLGWQAELSLEEALKDAWKWQKGIPQ